jgi:hypothetical protein
MATEAPNTKIWIIRHFVIGKAQLWADGPVMCTQILKWFRHKSAKQKRLWGGIIKFFLNGRVILRA